MTPQWWNAPADWMDATNTCANRCHNPSAGAKLSNAWTVANAAGCEFCHNSATAPASGQPRGAHRRNRHVRVDDHLRELPPEQRADGHMTGTVELANIAGATPYQAR